jgi:aspartate kinase
MYNAYGFLSGVFNALADHDVVVDLVSTSEVSISFTVDRQDEIEAAKPALAKLGKVAITPGRAILAAVGEGMKYAKGTSGRMFSALGDAGVNIEMISQGASEINISCVIKEEDVETGLRAVHRAFLEGA